MGRHKDRNPKRKRAYEIWLASGGRLRNKDIAQQVGVSADDSLGISGRNRTRMQRPGIMNGRSRMPRNSMTKISPTRKHSGRLSRCIGISRTG
jgi:hypothetical protein